jgi:hypothetical protein
MINCALDPAPSTTVGSAATLARLAHFLLPGFPQLSGWLTRSALARSPASASSSGNLFAPPSGARRVEGGWREPGRRPPAMLVAGAALLLVGGLLALDRYRDRGR